MNLDHSMSTNERLSEAFAEWDDANKALQKAKHTEAVHKDRVKEAVINAGKLYLLTINMKAVKSELYYDRRDEQY